jgi:hypothetical protein
MQREISTDEKHDFNVALTAAGTRVLLVPLLRRFDAG